MNRPHDTADGPCGCYACYQSHGSDPARPWVLKQVQISTSWERPLLMFHGVNLYSAPGEYGRTFWWYFAPPIHERPLDNRYDARNAEIEPAALEWFARWNVSQEVRL